MMVSSKFGGRPRAMRVPDVCKKKLAPGGEEEEGEPGPADVLHFWYWHDIRWFIWEHYYIGTIFLEKFAVNNWKTPTDPPVNGEWGTFQHFPDTKHFSASLQHYDGGVLQVTTNATDLPYPENGPFNTQVFDLTNPIWTGRKEGRIFNP